MFETPTQMRKERRLCPLRGNSGHQHPKQKDRLRGGLSEIRSGVLIRRLAFASCASQTQRAEAARELALHYFRYCLESGEKFLIMRGPLPARLSITVSSHSFRSQVMAIQY
jgi:hypothetical protein